MARSATFVVKQVNLGALKLFFAKCEWTHKAVSSFRRKLQGRYSDRFFIEKDVYPGRSDFIALRDQRAQVGASPSSNHAEPYSKELPWQLSWIADEIVLDHTSRGWVHIEGDSWPFPESVQELFQTA